MNTLILLNFSFYFDLKCNYVRKQSVLRSGRLKIFFWKGCRFSPTPTSNKPESFSQEAINSIRNCESIYLSIYLSIYGSTALCWTFAAFQFLNIFTQSVGFLGRGISQSQGRYLHTGQHEHRINAQLHPCLEWDSNPRSQCLNGRRQFIP
jgi:hypothetical protein